MKLSKLLIIASLILAVLLPVTATEVAAAPTHAGYSGACHSAIDVYWPRNWQPWAHRIVQRESRGVPSAANRSSSARGCFQMLLRYSSPFYKAVGCSNYNWANARCNVRAALVMRQRHGTRPWAVR